MKASLAAIQIQMVFEPSDNYKALVQQRDSLNSEILALNEDIGTLEDLIQQNMSDTDAAFALLQRANDEKDAAVQAFYTGFSGELSAARDGLNTSNSEYANSRAALENIQNFLNGLTDPAKMAALVAARDSVTVPDATPTAPEIGVNMVAQTGILNGIQQDIDLAAGQLQQAQNDLATAKVSRDKIQQELLVLQEQAAKLKGVVETLNDLNTGLNVNKTAMTTAFSLMSQLGGSRVIPSDANVTNANNLLGTATGIMNDINTQISTKIRIY
jgi:predicted  nucleic acid-binding Zn-ribbon protein